MTINNKYNTDLGSGTLEVVSVAAGLAVLSRHGAGAPAAVRVVNPVRGGVWKLRRDTGAK